MQIKIVVPQGSLLGPEYKLIIQQTIKFSEHVLYTDDI